MFTAADLIEALSARFRRRFPLLAERAFGEFPPTWRAWFLAIAERPGAVTGVPAGDFTSILSARAVRPPPRASTELGRWQSYRHLLRQQWGPAPADQRRTRRAAAGFSALLHLCFALLLLWVGFVRVGDAPPEAQQAGEAVQVEFIGEGTPVDEGGAAAPGQTDAPASAGAGQPAAAGGGQQAASAPPPPPFVAAAPPDADTPPQPSPPAEAASAQPLTVTESATPDPEFALPQTAVREIALPTLRPQTPTLATQVVEVETLAPSLATPTLRAPTPRQVSPTVPTLRSQVVEIETFQPTVPVQTLQAPAPRTSSPSVPALRTQVTEIDIHSPIATTPSAGIAQTPSRTPQLRAPELRAAPGEIALKPGSPGAAASSASSTASPRAPGNQAGNGTAPASSSAPGGRPQAQGSGRTAGTAPSGSGVRPSPRPGAATSTVRDDDWGASNRNVPGNASAGNGNTAGLFNSDGSVRLPGGSGDVGGGLPPGTIIEDFEKIDRMGTWLKRPPLDYTPTRFDRFWIPNKTLLEEWVSRGIKKVAIPIPGTTKRIECTVSLLGAGGSCRVYDPNLQDQEAIARPPPDVPYKPELREDKDGPATPPAAP